MARHRLYILNSALILMTTVLLSRVSQASSYDIMPYQQRCASGDEYISHPTHCTKFFECDNGSPVEKDCPGGTVFADTLNVCVHIGTQLDTCTPSHPDRECKRGTTDFIPHPTRCQNYYNCSDYVPYSIYNRHWSLGYEKECPFPKLFDIRLRKCVGYKNAICGPGRVEAKWKCDYYAEQCPVAMCRPCWVDNPSCVGKPNGLWPVPHALWSPYYIECLDERNFKGRLECKGRDFFDPEQRACVHDRLVKSIVPAEKVKK